MLQSMRHGIRFIPLAAALVALIVFAPTVLGQDGRIKCNDGRLVSSAADCLVPAEAGMEDEDGMSMEDKDGMSMEDEDGMSMEDEDGMSMEDEDGMSMVSSLWGEGDQAGASNWITDARVLDAAGLIQTGQIYELGRPYRHGMPLFGSRSYSLTIPGSPTGGPFPGGLIFHDEFVVGEIGQIGTQFDGLGHVGIMMGDDLGNKDKMLYYNGVTETELGGASGLAYGLQKLGIEMIKPIFTRGVLIDVAGYKGEMLDCTPEDCYVITLADVQGALERQGMSEDDIGEGDVVLFNTGWGSLWGVEDDRYGARAPGIGIEVGRWLSARNITMVGADTWPVEVTVAEDPGDAFPVHKHLLVENGILIHENLNLAGLAEDEVYEFAYIFVRVPFKGGTGSPGSPIAVR